jgi:hypothetical protein
VSGRIRGWRPPCSPAPEPGLVARTDQDAALLADLVDTARRHHDRAHCPRPRTCPGEGVDALLEKAGQLDPSAPWRVLLLAIAELAARGGAGA